LECGDGPIDGQPERLPRSCRVGLDAGWQNAGWIVSPEGGLAAVDVASGKIRFSLDGFDTTNPYPGNPGFPKWDGSFLITTMATNLTRWNAFTGEMMSRIPTPAVPDYSSGFGGELVISAGWKACGRWGIRDGRHHRAGADPYRP